MVHNFVAEVGFVAGCYKTGYGSSCVPGGQGVSALLVTVGTVALIGQKIFSSIKKEKKEQEKAERLEAEKTGKKSAKRKAQRQEALRQKKFTRKRVGKEGKRAQRARSASRKIKGHHRLRQSR